MARSLIWFWTCVIGFMLHPAFGTEVCMECRPLELQRAPGLGINLGMSYGTASIKIRNGAIIDIVKIPGSEEYVSAMKSFAEDALRVRDGANSSLPAVNYKPVRKVSFAELASNPTISNLWKYLTQYFYWYFPNLDPTAQKLDPWIEAITTMLSNLKSAVWANIPLSERLIALYVPDCEADTGHIYNQIFKIAAQRAGFEPMLPVRLASRSLLEVFDIIDCDGSLPTPDPPCPSERKERVDVMLSVSYSEFSLGITLLTRWMDARLWGHVWPQRVSEAVELGYEAPLRLLDPDQYWEKVKALIVDAVEGESVDRIFFLGSHGDDEELRKAVRATLEEHSDGHTIDISGGTAEECTFIAARGGAIVARRGMRSGFDACLVPDRCEIDGVDEDGKKIEGKEKNGKSEL